MNELLEYLSTLTVTQGRRAGLPFEVLPWQKRLVRGAFKPSVSTAALSLGRVNGKTTLVAGLACATLDGPLAVPRGETVIVASSFEQARVDFEHVISFMASRADLDDKKTWRVWDTAQQARVEHRPTGARVRCIGSDPRRAHGLAPTLVLADEPSQWPPNTAERMVAALRTAAGKQPHCLFIALGTRPDDSEHFFQRMLDGGADFSLCYSAGTRDPIGYRRTWKKANPSLDYMPDLERELRQEAALAKKDPSELASFQALRLNLGVSDTVEAVILDPDTWRRIEGDAPALGDMAWGVDLGASAAMSAVCAYWPRTGRLVGIACFPSEPDLRQRGLRDGVGGLYQKMHERGELFLAGQHTSDIGELLNEARRRWGVPSVLVCDTWREAELREVLEEIGFPVVPLELRRNGPKDGSEDLRRFRRACLEGRVRPVQSLLMRSALAEARAVGDASGNWRLAKKSEAGRRQRAKDDVLAGAIIAVGTAERLYKGPREAIRADLRAVSMASGS